MRRVLVTPVGRALGGLLLLGLGLRLLAEIAYWPVGLALNDSAPYTTAAATNPLSDVQHPAGYPAFLAAVGWFTRQVADVIILQHLLGILAAVVFFAAVRRVTTSSWWALLPAAIILLSGDEIYLEHNLMAEGPTVTLLAVTFYAGVRTLEDPRSKRWAVIVGLLVGLDGLARSAALCLLPVVPLAILLTTSPTRPRLTAAALTLGASVLVLVAYGFANLAANHEFELGPKPGWHLYGMVAHYADCADFTPPPGTRVLCQSIPPNQRPGLNYYLDDPNSPAQREFGYFKDDTKVGAFAEQVVLNEPGHYLRNVASNLLAYFVPSTYPSAYGGCAGPGHGCPLNIELNWTHDTPDETTLKEVLETFYKPFHTVKRHWARQLLHDWQRGFGFGATMLTITTLLTLIGLVMPGKRAYILLFGGGGISLLLAPSLIGFYVARYSVPMAAPMLAAAAITADKLWLRWRYLAVTGDAVQAAQDARPHASSSPVRRSRGCQ